MFYPAYVAICFDRERINLGRVKAQLIRQIIQFA
jgi:hypothetical protein